MENRKAHPAAIVPEGAFARTEEKIEHSFAAGYGTVLFFEDTDVRPRPATAVSGLCGEFPGMVGARHRPCTRLAVWTMLEDAGLGASLQHYNPLIDDEVRQTLEPAGEWKLVAQMPFGTPAGEPGEKTFKPLDERIRVFR